MTATKNLIKIICEDTNIDLDSDIVVHDNRFYDYVFQYGSLGLGESYMNGWWDAGSKNIDNLICDICEAELKSKLMNLSWRNKLKTIYTASKLYFFPVNTIAESKVVALEHYNLGNELYENMLGKHMVYSCGYMENYIDRIDDMQMAKIKRIAAKLNLKPGMRVLDIGCGWGELAHHLHKLCGVCVDGISISVDQIEYANSHFANGDVQFYLTDYRLFKTNCDDIPGVNGYYDAIVSVGMFEHVNQANYKEFMQIANRLLKPNGLFLLHTIGASKPVIAPDAWISKYIFPNSCLPALCEITACAEPVFVVEDVENFGVYYDHTLMAWYHNFKNNFDIINLRRVEMGKPILDDRFRRMWEYYLLSCAGAFRAKKIQLYQVVFSKGRYVKYNRMCN